MSAQNQDTPEIRTVGLDGVLVTFAPTLTEAANRAAIGYSAAVRRANWAGVAEVSTSLTSVYLRLDLATTSHATVRDQVAELLTESDWYQAPLPEGRRFWRVPTVYGTDLAPQLAEAADAAGMSEAAAIDSLGSARVRVLTIGFAPGQPYLGPLGPEWNLPRQTELTPRVPRGALVQAISQFVLFSAETPTGWRHVGQTGFMIFQPDAPQPFALRAGDEMKFEPVEKADFLKLVDRDPALGGATCEEIRP